MSASKYIKVFGIVVVMAVTLTAGLIVGSHVAHRTDYKTFHAYPLLDPSVDNPSVYQEIINFDPLRQNVKNYLASLQASHSFYFEYLSNGIEILDGQDNTSEAASLLQTPVVMDMYKLSELGKLNLDTQLVVQSSEISTDQDYGNPTNLKAGDKITYRQAAQLTLHDSDNTTLNVIRDHIVNLVDAKSDSFRSLDITYVVDSLSSNSQISISSRSYSSILKCLYYACFNTPADSTTMINALSGSTGSNRLTAGVPAGTNVAHKLGSAGTNSQSDCGIVYVPGRPYLVCLMFFNIPTTTNVDPYFATVSQMIYNYVSDPSLTTE